VRLLLVGDTHVTVDELEDAQKLLDGVLSVVQDRNVDKVVFLGDQHHNHAVVRVEVTDFWLRNLRRFTVPAILLVGNHDRPNDMSSTAHALQPYTYLENVTVVNEPTVIDECAYIPYIHSKEEFQKAAFDLSDKARFLICHQTFDGSKYENGFYAPDGADPAMIGSYTAVFAGHIHTYQTISSPLTTVHYVGSPRWRTVSDANVSKDLWIFDTKTGLTELIGTHAWCSPIGKSAVSLETDLESLPFASDPNARQHLDAIAKSEQMEDLIQKIRQRFPRAKIRPLPIDKKTVASVKESDGVFNALRRFVESSKPPFGTDPQFLQELIARRLNVN
jgi:DNA repair exonuclease SbcCD nuclease subunit